MLIFIISVLLVSFISLCFFKNKFWQNRYLILCICCGVALVTTLITNYSVRGKLQTKAECLLQESIIPFNLNYTTTSLANDSTWNFKYEKVDTILKCTGTDKKRTMSLVFYGGKKHLMIGFLLNYKPFLSRRRPVIKYYKFNEIYIIPSISDSIAFFTIRILSYDTKSNNWVTGLSLPIISTMWCLYIPPKEYAMLPDSLIRKLPF